METSIGIDLVEVHRFDTIDKKSRFVKNIFTPGEIKSCFKKKNPSESMAGRFAAKEAVKKTLKENIKFNEIEIINEESGEPKINFLDEKLNKKYKPIISISHAEEYAIAVCLMLKI
jgi:holo-[acyl-carrier protein] synthase